MVLSIFYYCICFFLCRRPNFNPSLCPLSPFLLSYVTVSRPCRLSEFYRNSVAGFNYVAESSSLGLWTQISLLCCF